MKEWGNKPGLRMGRKEEGTTGIKKGRYHIR
jgi:hypothetical protein